MNCFKCHKNFMNISDAIKCSVCMNHFHASCTRLESLDKWKKKNSEHKSAWKCDDCLKAGKGDSSQCTTDTGFDQILKSISDLRNEFMSLFTEKIVELSEQIKILNKTSNETNVRLEQLTNENKTVMEKCSELENINKDLNKTVSLLQEEINLLHQQTRLENIEITGIMETNGEDLYSVMESIARVIDIDFKRDDVSAIHRVPSKKQVKPIIVKFVSRQNKMNWILAAKRKRTLMATEINAKLKEDNVYINEHLSPYFKTILGLAKGLKRENKLTFVWVREGKILYRETVSSPVKRAIRKSDLDKYLS